MRPEIIKKFWYSIEWDVASLWALELPHYPMPISELSWHMDVPVWPDELGSYQVTPRQVLDSPGIFTWEYRRIQNADLSYPLEIIRRCERWMILDGCHRLARAVELKQPSLNVREVPFSAVEWLS